MQRIVIRKTAHDTWSVLFPPGGSVTAGYVVVNSWKAACVAAGVAPNMVRLPDGTVLTNVHGRARCIGPCVIHAPTDHHMRDWPLVWRADLKIFERVCPHHVGHPDPDNLGADLGVFSVHGCDGCCQAR